jgi:hypothetical protein
MYSKKIEQMKIFFMVFSSNVFSIVCDLLSSIHILCDCACVHFTASFFFWIKGAALLFLPSELSDIALLHGTGLQVADAMVESVK